MKKLILAVVLSAVSAGAMANRFSDSYPDNVDAQMLNVVEAAGNYDLVTGTIPEGSDENLSGYVDGTNITAKVDGEVVAQINQGMTCQQIKDDANKRYNDAFSKFSKKHGDTKLVNKARVRLVNAIAMYARAKCTEINN